MSNSENDRLKVESRMSRAGFLGMLWASAGKRLADSLHNKMQAVQKPFSGERHFLRPPGAQPNDHLFMALCTRCDACTAACPYDALSVHYGAGYPYDGTPVLANLSTSPCLLCEDFPCIAACPTDALQTLDNIREVVIGEAKIDNTTCVAYQGKACQVCVDVCPLPQEAIALVEGLPQVYSACTGCGICQAHCPVENPEDGPAIRVFPIQTSSAH